ncbi:mandelate racemase/muconate lactonizing enzyme family protein [Paenibacillus montanisoli]|uniref:Mandelate racemase/muconate lactonizing enzyme family protein n=1 Tax=Paenibacillus montanisoli TaxID=2081970 RepID=A0A328TYX6_9BACL|nr:mandelate racemase/muconate lactonizing enzyme family protein [Paenibacillus montanisoli]RAP75718.1 mandelate racemase/muconate lactonizing enzyme family protein [Paenibacillus montanisoli]
MKITNMTTFLFPWGSLFIKLETDEGISGWGECSPMGGHVLQAMAVHALKPHVIGGNPFDVEVLWEKMLLAPYKLGPSGAQLEAISGIDLAMWDIIGKATNKPIYELQGGRFRDRVNIYYSYGWDGRATVDEVARIMSSQVENGFTVLKLRMNYGPLKGEIANDPAIPMMKAIRAAVGDEVKIGFDANNGYTAHKAIQIGRYLEEHVGLAWFEEPTPQYDYLAMAQVADALDTPVSAGEHEYTLWQFRDLILQGKADIIQPDLVKCGGITEAKKIAALCEAFSKPIVVHNTQPTIGTAASLHYCASVSNAMYHQEFTGHNDKLLALFHNQLEFKDGYLFVPDGPGLGLEVNEKRVRETAISIM